MVFFLTCISVVLILVGGAAALYGADTIRSETGATIAIAGVSVACAGFLLLGLVQVSVELRRLRRAVEEQDELEMPPRAAVPPLPAVPALAAAPAAAVAESGTPGSRPDTGDGAEADKGATPETSPGKDVDPAADPGSSVETAVDTDLLEAAEGKGPPPVEPPPPPQPAKERGEPVATYTSGANTYFMYGDGTIEAETPKGRYRFDTMADLRHYAETGEGGLLLKAADDSEPSEIPARPGSREGTITI